LEDILYTFSENRRL